MKYRFLLFDADDTLFDFRSAERNALELAMKDDGREYHGEYHEVYAAINAALWKQLELGTITKPELLQKRFRNFFDAIGISEDASHIRECYQKNLEQQGIVLPGALELCQQLSQQFELYLITNGLERTQTKRLERSGLLPCLKKVFISETIGFPKPQKEFFDAVAAEITEFDEKKALIIGDSLSSDIRGGNNTGIDTCWYNAKGEINETVIMPTYEVKNYEELVRLVI